LHKCPGKRMPNTYKRTKGKDAIDGLINSWCGKKETRQEQLGDEVYRRGHRAGAKKRRRNLRRTEKK